MDDSSERMRNRTAIAVALVGLLGTITVGVINNWEKIFPASNQATAQDVQPDIEQRPPAVAPVDSVPTIQVPLEFPEGGTSSGEVEEAPESLTSREEFERTHKIATLPLSAFHFVDSRTMGTNRIAILSGPTFEGYAVQIGDRIGRSDAIVDTIEKNKIWVRESYFDSNGISKQRRYSID